MEVHFKTCTSVSGVGSYLAGRHTLDEAHREALAALDPELGITILDEPPPAAPAAPVPEPAPSPLEAIHAAEAALEAAEAFLVHPAQPSETP